MIDGYNSQFDRQGAKFLVQTQDMGMGARYLETLIYCAGKLLTSKKTFYTSFLNSPNIARMIHQILEDQHKDVLQEIADGKFDRFLPAGRD